MQSLNPTSLSTADFFPRREWSGCRDGDRFIRRLGKHMSKTVKRKSDKRHPRKKYYRRDRNSRRRSHSRWSANRVQKYYFRENDLNSNGILEKNEMKKIKQDVRNLRSRGFKKCIRNFFGERCDTNQDGAVDTTEFELCTKVLKSKSRISREETSRKARKFFL